MRESDIGMFAILFIIFSVAFLVMLYFQLSMINHNLHCIWKRMK